ncbi:MAG TPA: ATP-dependent sacrificial sulfur transferase LarE [Candidatus Limnocylindrales bacterium]|nr:ATP-dependent sacrificial sulfur transferase LarE [Candidatus Limnocylindrales bacterium]
MTISSDARHELVARVAAALGAEDAARVMARFSRLPAIVEDLGSCVLALSGGIDSSFLLAVAAELLGPRCLAVTADSAAVPAWDRTDARAAGTAAADHGSGWRVVATRELDDPRYAQNPRSRCYFCKAEVYGALAGIAHNEGYAWVVDGSNATDAAATDRPGMAAGAALRVRSPLAEAGITKADVRVLARALGLPDWDRPSSACLSSRIPFGARITPERLRRVETAELAIRARGFRQVRVRDLGERARVEVDTTDLERLVGDGDAVGSLLRAAGFAGWTASAYAGTGAGDRVDPAR